MDGTAVSFKGIINADSPVENLWGRIAFRNEVLPVAVVCILYHGIL